MSMLAAFQKPFQLSTPSVPWRPRIWWQHGSQARLQKNKAVSCTEYLIITTRSQVVAATLVQAALDPTWFFCADTEIFLFQTFANNLIENHPSLHYPIRECHPIIQLLSVVPI